MSRVVILEGPDGSGKTTLAGKFISEGYSYKHCGVPAPGEDLLQTYAGMILAAAESQGKTVIDRCYIGESVYGPVMRGYDALGSDKAALLNRLCKCLGVIQVVCLPAWSTVLANWTLKKAEAWDPITHKGDYVTGEQKLAEIYNLYQRHLLTNPDLVRYDYEAGRFSKDNQPCQIVNI